jgi:hypothetical protein
MWARKDTENELRKIHKAMREKSQQHSITGTIIFPLFLVGIQIPSLYS